MGGEKDSVIPNAQQRIEKEEKKVIDHNFAPTASEKVDEGVKEVAKELKINLPENNTPLVVRLIGVLLLVGGLSMLGSTFGDLFNSSQPDITTYILRIVGGVAFIVISYGLLKQKQWSIWLFAVVVIVGAFFNYFVAILPALIVVYLFFERDYFKA
jgi:hypothetical protein